MLHKHNCVNSSLHETDQHVSDTKKLLCFSCMLSHCQTTNMWLRNVPPVLTRLADFNWNIYHAKTRGGCAPPQRPLTGEMQETEQLTGPNHFGLLC